MNFHWFLGGEDGEVFRNRKSFCSINTQVVCDAHLRVRDIVARWPGATHDATIYANSRIRARFEANEFPNCLLLGRYCVHIPGYLFALEFRL